MGNEVTYFALAFLVAVFLLLTLLRIIRAARGTIYQLQKESRRDRLQRERIAKEREFQQRALRRGTRRIDGKAHKVSWDNNDRRASRSYHVDEAADEVFDPVSDVRGMDVRTPWGWPSSTRKTGAVPNRYARSTRSRVASSITGFFKPKKVKDTEYQLRRERSIRSLVEDRYGRVGQHTASQMPEFEWSKPKLPAELIEERKHDQMLANKPDQDVDLKQDKLRGLRVVDGKASKDRKVSGA